YTRKSGSSPDTHTSWPPARPPSSRPVQRGDLRRPERPDNEPEPTVLARGGVPPDLQLGREEVQGQQQLPSGGDPAAITGPQATSARRPPVGCCLRKTHRVQAVENR